MKYTDSRANMVGSISLDRRNSLFPRARRVPLRRFIFHVKGPSGARTLRKSELVNRGATRKVGWKRIRPR